MLVVLAFKVGVDDRERLLFGGRKYYLGQECCGPKAEKGARARLGKVGHWKTVENQTPRALGLVSPTSRDVSED